MNNLAAGSERDSVVRFTFLLALCVLLSILLAACGSLQEEASAPVDAPVTPTTAGVPPTTIPIPPTDTLESPTASPTRTPMPTHTPSSTLAPPAESILASALAASNEAESFHMAMIIEYSYNMTVEVSTYRVIHRMEFEGDTQTPDRMAGTIVSQTSYGGRYTSEPTEIEIVAIGNKSYFRNPGSEEWTAETGKQVISTDFFLTTLGNSSLTELKSSGLKSLNGESVHHLNGKFKLEELLEIIDLLALESSGASVDISAVDVDCWISVEEGLIRKIELSFSVVTTADDVDADTREVHIGYLYTDYGKNIEIQAPIVGE